MIIRRRALSPDAPRVGLSVVLDARGPRRVASPLSPEATRAASAAGFCARLWRDDGARGKRRRRRGAATSLALAARRGARPRSVRALRRGRAEERERYEDAPR